MTNGDSFTLRISSENLTRMHKMMGELGTTSSREFFNYALMVLDWVNEQHNEGHIIVSMNPETGDYKELVLAGWDQK